MIPLGFDYYGRYLVTLFNQYNLPFIDEKADSENKLLFNNDKTKKLFKSLHYEYNTKKAFTNYMIEGNYMSDSYKKEQIAIACRLMNAWRYLLGKNQEQIIDTKVVSVPYKKGGTPKNFCLYFNSCFTKTIF